MSDAKYFSTTKKGEMKELEVLLHSTKKSDQRDAVKKVIASMTIGKDVSGLFTHVISCMQSDNLELKKLVYLYLINYAKSHPEQTLMAVNTFVKDCKDPNPLIRALAVRTMGCIRVDKITEHICMPLHETLRDDDPYVRKTAAICVAKLYDIDPELVVEEKFIEELTDLLSDANPMVVANAVAALSEIHEYSRTGPVFDLTQGTVQKLLTALNECNEWGQVFILDALALYEPVNDSDRQSMCERITPRLQHVNAAVVLSAVKVLMKNVEYLQNAEAKLGVYKKLAPPLVTLLSSEPEVQYVALRNINLIVQKRPKILASHMKVFFVKYNDPVYVKMEKLDVMIRLATEDTIQQVLAELKEYSTEVDVDFVRKSVRAIGRCAIKVEASAQRCVDTLLDLIKTKVNYVVQEAIVVIKDIFRKYPNKYESIIGTLCDNLESLDEPDAKASMIWIIGEYAERIDNADELLESFLENFTDESSPVQLQLLTAIVKLFLKRPTNTQSLVQKVLGLATQESDNPDLRDRGYVYWRLLLADPAAAKAVVLCEKPLISEETDLLEPSLLDELICHISSLASVFHKPPSTFIEGRIPGRRVVPAALFEAEEQAPGEVDLLGGALADTQISSAHLVLPKQIWVDEETGKGIEILGTFSRVDGQIFMDMTFTNKSTAAIGDFAIQFNKNSFGLAPAAGLSVPSLAPNASYDTCLPVNCRGGKQKMDPLQKMQIAVKTSVDVLYFSVMLPFHPLFVEDGKLERGEYLRIWKEIEDSQESIITVHDVTGSIDDIVKRFESCNVFLIARRRVNDQELCYMCLKFINDVITLAEISFDPSGTVAKVAIRAHFTEVIRGLQDTFSTILKGTAADAEC
eukprot:m.135904 g.135904  ORF g.135904 m.135904 type:complete len:860 (+) comp10300_c0_seq1:96-2675(+)